MTDQDLDRVYERLGEASLTNILDLRVGIPSRVVHRMRWAVDDATSNFLWSIPSRRDEIGFRYVFACEEGVLVLELTGHCRFTMLHASDSLAQQFGMVKPRVTEALRICGKFMDGTTDPTNTRSFPGPKFISAEGVEL